jgi:hypothetical protein
MCCVLWAYAHAKMSEQHYKANRKAVRLQMILPLKQQCPVQEIFACVIRQQETGGGLLAYSLDGLPSASLL